MYAVRIGIHEYCNVKDEIMKMEGTYTKILPHLEWPLICRCDSEFPWGPCRGECRPERPPWVEAAISQTGVIWPSAMT